MKYLKLCMYFILIFCFIEFILFTIIRQFKRKIYYKNAKEDSKELNLPLMVVGDPDGGWVCRNFGRIYNCGDVCVDIKGCPNCKNSIQDNIHHFQYYMIQMSIHSIIHHHYYYLLLYNSLERNIIDIHFQYKLLVFQIAILI